MFRSEHRVRTERRRRQWACLAGWLALLLSAPANSLGQDDVELLKLEEMILPDVETLLRGDPVDWIVKPNDEVIVTEPVYPRPDTLKKMQQEIEASFKWPRPRNAAEVEQQNRRRLDLNFVTIVLPGEETEFRMHMKDIAQIVYHEDLMLRRVDQLITDGDLRTAFEMLFSLEQSAANWPGASRRRQDLVFRDAQLKRNDGRHETAFVLLEQLHEEADDYPGINEAFGAVADTLVTAAIETKDYRRAQHYLERLRKRKADHPIYIKWRDQLDGQALALFTSARTAAQGGQHDVAAALARQAAEIWPVPPNRRPTHNNLLLRWQQLKVGVVGFASDNSAYFLPTAAERRHRRLTEVHLFEVNRYDDVPRFGTRMFEQWEPTDLGRRVDFVLRQDQDYWESIPQVTANTVVDCLLARLDPDGPRANERFAAFVDSLEVRGPFEFTVYFNRVPLRTESLFRFPVERIDTAESEVLTKRFVAGNQDGAEVVYRRAVNEPDRSPIYHVAEVIEVKFDNHEDAVQAALRGDLQYLPDVQPWDVDAFRNNNRFFVQNYANPLVHVLQVNPNSKPLRNRELRRALAVSIDREAILARVILRDPEMRYGRLASAPFPSDSYAHSPLVGQRAYDLTLGLSLSIAARKALKVEQIPTLKLLCAPDPTVRAAAQELIKNWKRIKLNVELIPDDGQSIDRDSADWDLIYRVDRMQEPLVDLWPYLTLRDTARVEDLKHLPDWLRQELIRLDNVGSWTNAIAQLHELHRHLSQEAHTIPLWEVDQHAVFERVVSGFPGELINAYQNVEQWIRKP